MPDPLTVMTDPLDPAWVAAWETSNGDGGIELIAVRGALPGEETRICCGLRSGPALDDLLE